MLKEEVVLIYCFEDGCKRVWWGPSTPQVAVTLVVAAALPSATGGSLWPRSCYSLGWGHALLSLWPSAPSSGGEGWSRNKLEVTAPLWRGRQALLTQVFLKATRSRLVAQDHHATLIKILE